jgi:hypothetical protein
VPDALHIHTAGRVTGWSGATAVRLRSAGRRLLLAHIVPWGQAVEIHGDKGTFLEWFRKGSIDRSSRPPLMLKHTRDGGQPVGTCLRLFETPLGLDGVFEVFAGDLGDGVLDLIDQHRRVPCSAGFFPLPHGHRAHVEATMPGVERVGVDLAEVALCHQGAYPQAYVRRYGT